MRSLLITVMLAVTAIVLAGCRNKKPEPVPAPQSGLVQRTMAAHGGRDTGESNATARAHCPSERRSGTSEISWFQGTVEEAFSRHRAAESHAESHTLFRY